MLREAVVLLKMAEIGTAELDTTAGIPDLSFLKRPGMGASLALLLHPRSLSLALRLRRDVRRVADDAVDAVGLVADRDDDLAVAAVLRGRVDHARDMQNAVLDGLGVPVGLAPAAADLVLAVEADDDGLGLLVEPAEVRSAQVPPVAVERHLPGRDQRERGRDVPEGRRDLRGREVAADGEDVWLQPTR